MFLAQNCVENCDDGHLCRRIHSILEPLRDQGQPLGWMIIHLCHSLWSSHPVWFTCTPSHSSDQVSQTFLSLSILLRSLFLKPTHPSPAPQHDLFESTVSVVCWVCKRSLDQGSPNPGSLNPGIGSQKPADVAVCLPSVQCLSPLIDSGL